MATDQAMKTTKTSPSLVPAEPAPGSSLALTWVFPAGESLDFDRARCAEGRQAGGGRLAPGIHEVTERAEIGRDRASGSQGIPYVLLDDDQVSRLHAVVQIAGSCISIVDGPSKNGVFVNGEKVQKAVLRLGDVLRCGSNLAVVTHAPGQPSLIAGELWGGATLRAAFEPARLAAEGDSNLVIEGETGTGKELTARAVHELGGRRPERFVAVNCPELIGNTAPSLLLGTKLGSFTDAQDREGYFVQAHGGTLLLDELCDLDERVQAQLLRVVETHKVRPMGDKTEQAVSTRVIAAAQRPLPHEVETGRLRRDLFERLAVSYVRLPPLRERREDIPSLFQRALSKRLKAGKVPTIDAQLMEKLLCHTWPGNVRELENLANRLATSHATATQLGLEHLPAFGAQLVSGASTAPSVRPSAAPPADVGHDDAKQLGRDEIARALATTGQNIDAAARLLQVDRSRLRRRLKKFPDIDPRTSR